MYLKNEEGFAMHNQPQKWLIITRPSVNAIQNKQLVQAGMAMV